MNISHNWLKWYTKEVPEAERLAETFTYHLCEVESYSKTPDGDTVFDLNILPNRAHDLLSHLGIAREISGLLGLSFTEKIDTFKIPETKGTALSISIQSDSCRRYMGRIVRGIKVGPSPEWVVKHLESIGQRSINNIVDATNITMYDCGNPTHAFDARKLASEKIFIRAAKPDESITTLDGKVVTLRESDAVIADQNSVLAIAGVKGGTAAEVDDSTTEILLEVANFAPTQTRKTARRIGLLTDAAKRFENDLSPELVPYAMRELSALILEMCPDATFEDIVDEYPNPQQARTLTFSVARINAMLGATIAAERVATILTNYAFDFTQDGDLFTIQVPPLRLDLVGEHDMAEEIGRVIGYDTLVPVLPKISFLPKKNDTYLRMSAARQHLLAEGYSEAMTYAFGKKGKVEVARGAKGAEFLRTNLTDGLKKAYEENRLNAPLLGMDAIKMFEIGAVFPEKDVEEIRVAYADKSGVTEVSLEEFTKDMMVGSVPAPVLREPKAFVPWSVYPFVTRDIAVWVGNEADSDALKTICATRGGTLLAREPRMFDSFSKDGRFSVGYRMVFQAHDRTLTEAEVNPIMAAIDADIRAKGWEVR